MADNVTALAARAPAAIEWSEDQRALIKRTVAPDATNDELAMFLHVAAKAGLDPLQKQVWFVKRKQNVGTRESPKWEDRVTIQAGVDGLQARALRMPDCEGIQSAVVYAKDDFVFDKAKGEVVRHLGNPFGGQGDIVGAWAIVRRAGKLPFVALVRYGEYVDDRSFLWKNKPAVMIEKVARSTALRRAYPEDFAGIYEPAEMGTAAHVEPTEPAPALPAPEVPPQVEAAAKVLEAEVVKPEPPKEPVRRGPPQHVLALFSRIKKAQGEEHARDAAGTKKSQEVMKRAAEAAGLKKPSNEWTPDEAAKVAEIIFGDNADVPF